MFFLFYTKVGIMLKLRTLIITILTFFFVINTFCNQEERLVRTMIKAILRPIQRSAKPADSYQTCLSVFIVISTLLPFIGIHRPLMYFFFGPSEPQPTSDIIIGPFEPPDVMTTIALDYTAKVVCDLPSLGIQLVCLFLNT